MLDGGSSTAKFVKVARRHHLFRAEDRAGQCFFIEEGLVTRERTLENGRRQIVGFNVPGDVCGLGGLVSGCADCDAIAHTPVTCVPLEGKWLLSEARQSADLFASILAELAHEAALAAAWIVNLGQRTAYQRIAYLACELASRSNPEASDGEVRWRGTQSDISAATGLSVVHVNRTLKSLADERLASSGKGIVFTNLARLRAICNFESCDILTGRDRLGTVLALQNKQRTNPLGPVQALALINNRPWINLA